MDKKTLEELKDLRYQAKKEINKLYDNMMNSDISNKEYEELEKEYINSIRILRIINKEINKKV